MECYARPFNTLGNYFSADVMAIYKGCLLYTSRTPTADDIQDGYEEDELIDDYDLPAHWLMMQMNNFCVGANYVFFNGKHYYTVHHS